MAYEHDNHDCDCGYDRINDCADMARHYPTFSTLACDAAVDIDNARLGRKGTMRAPAKLVDILRTTFMREPAAVTEEDLHALTPQPIVMLDAVLERLGESRCKTTRDLYTRWYGITQELDSILQRSIAGTHAAQPVRGEEYERFVDVCLSLSQMAGMHAWR